MTRPPFVIRPRFALAALAVTIGVLATTPLSVGWLSPNGGRAPALFVVLGLGRIEAVVSRPGVTWDGEPGFSADWYGWTPRTTAYWVPHWKTPSYGWVDVRLPWWLLGLIVLAGGVRPRPASATRPSPASGYERADLEDRPRPECGGESGDANAPAAER